MNRSVGLIILTGRETEILKCISRWGLMKSPSQYVKTSIKVFHGLYFHNQNDFGGL